MPIGDLQYAGDDDAIALSMLKRHIQWGVDHNAYFIGMGDYIDTFSPSNRQRLANANLYDTAKQAISKAAERFVTEIYEKALAPSKGRWLGLLEGHHYHELDNGETTDGYLARLLGAPALGTSAYVRLQFTRKRADGAGRHDDVLIWAHHGVGGGQGISAPINKLAPMIQGFNADIYIMGHFTSKDGKPIDYVQPIYPKNGGKPQLVYRTKILACTGGFMKSYRAGSRYGNNPRGNYAEQGMMRPAALGGVLIKIRPRWTVQNGVEIWRPDLGIEL